MSVLEHLEPQRVFYYFEQLCAIPHGSGNTKGVSDYCVSFAKDHGLRYKQYPCGNVILYKSASPGYENAPTVILQGHLDMVCVKTEDCAIDFCRDGLQLAVENGYVRAVGTSLGGDDTIAIAMALAILEDDTLPHPPLEALFTVEEETGMEGAMAVDFGDLQGRRLINIDSEEEGVITAGCAGGVHARCVLPVRRETRRGVRCTLRVEGLQGGHSGTDIHRQRPSATVLLGRALDTLRSAAPFRLVALASGTVANAIPVSAEAVMLADETQVEALAKAVEFFETLLCREYRGVDEGIRLMLRAEGTETLSAMDTESTQRAVDALVMLPFGVQVMSCQLPGLVQTSLNMGVLCTGEGQVEMLFSVRSSVDSQKDWLCRRLDGTMAHLGGTVEYSGSYPTWTFDGHSPLRALAVECYTRLFGAAPGITATHGGLECGLFCGREPTLDCISVGPNILDIHSPRERLDVASTERVYRLVREILRHSR